MTINPEQKTKKSHLLISLPLLGFLLELLPGGRGGDIQFLTEVIETLLQQGPIVVASSSVSTSPSPIVLTASSPSSPASRASPDETAPTVVSSAPAVVTSAPAVVTSATAVVTSATAVVSSSRSPASTTISVGATTSTAGVAVVTHYEI